MKKYLLSVFAAASMLFAASCSEEENFAESNKQSVTFKVEVEGAGASSRTITDGSNHISIGKGQMVDKLFYAVYEHNDQADEALLEGQANVINGVATVNIPLVNGVHYDLVFLAYNDADNAFGIKQSNELSFPNGVCPDVDLTQLTLRNNLVANQETYDAFYHVVKDYTTNTSSTTPVALHRMFAQLNVATTDDDLTNAKQLKVNVTQSAIKVLKNVPTTFNARGENVGGHQDEFTFSVANVLKCSQKDVASVHGKPLIHDNEQLTVKKNGQDEYFNYLAMAYVLADKEKSLHDVEVSFYRGEENGTSSELFHTRSIPSVPMQRLYRTNVTGNILTQQEAFSISLDLDFGDHNKTVGDVVIIPSGDSQALQAAIENAQPNVPVEIQLEGNITLDGSWSTINGRAASGPNNQNVALFIKEGNTIILDLNGCTLSTPLVDGSETNHLYAFENHGSLIIKDTNGNGTIKARGIFNYGDMTLESGTINAIDGNGGYGVRNYEGATFTMNGGTIATTLEDDNQVNEGGYDASPLRVDEGATATINGGAINNICDFTVAIDNYGTTTINGGTFTTVHTTIANSGTMTIDGGEFYCNGLEGITAHALWAAAGTTTINGGTFDGKDNYNGFNVDASEGATVYIKGGKFLFVHSGSLYGKGTIVVTGGNFFDEVAENRLANGYCTVKQNDNTYTIVADNSLQAEIDNATNGATITLDANVALPESLVIPEGKTLTLDLNNYTIEGPSVAKDAEGNRIHVIVNNGTLTIKNGTVKSIAVNGGSAVLNTGVLTLEDATINGAPSNTAAGTASYAVNSEGEGTTLTVNNSNISGRGAIGATSGTKVEINGGTFHTPAVAWGHAVYASNEGTEVVINNGTFSEGYEMTANNWGMYQIYSGDKAKVTVKGGTFMPWDCANGYDLCTASEGIIEIVGGIFAEDPSNQNNKNYVAEGYISIENQDGTWTVVKNVAAMIGTVEYATLQEAFNIGGDITLYRDLTLTETVELVAGKSATLDLNGKKITSGYQANSDSKHIYPINNYGDLTIKNGTIEGRGIYNQDGAKLTVNGATVNGLDWNGGACVWSYGTGEVYLNNATMTGCTGIVSSEGYLEINGGTYTCYSGIDDNGKQITSPTYNIRAYNGLKITDGTFTSRHGVISASGGEALIEGGSYTIKFAATTTSNVVYVYGSAKMTIKGGDFISDNSNNKADSGAAVVVIGTNAKVDIYNGTFIGMNGMVSGNAKLYGGTFNTVWDYNHYDNLKDKLGEGHEATQNADGSWTVKASEQK